MNKYPAISVIEISSIASGILSADAMVKCSPISVLKSGTVHKGKYLVLIGGSVAAVEEAFFKGLSIAGEQVLDKVILPDVHTQVHDGIFGNRLTCSAEALGIIETSTVAAVIKSADAGVKGAHVDLVEIRLADDLGGKAFALFNGRVEQVEAAVQIAKQATTNPDFWLNDIIIPRLDKGLAQQIDNSTLFAQLDFKTLDGGEI
jgi:microcompartment protein CcmL/EutN